MNRENERRALAVAYDIAKEQGVDASWNWVPAIVARWILDSGSGNHLSNRKDLTEEQRRSIRQLVNPVLLATGNGVITARDSVELAIEFLNNMSIQSILLNGIPNVVSIGRLVIDSDCDFEWTRISKADAARWVCLRSRG